MFDAKTRELMLQAAQEQNLDPAALSAIAQIESGGIVTTRIQGRDEPLNRFEGHYFDKRLSPAEQAKARALGLSSPKAGAIANSPNQAARWILLNRAAAINRDAAYESTSWGIGQVMGAHWHWLGYPSVTALVEDVRRSVKQQIDLMVRFIIYSHLCNAVNNHEWQKIAHNYNGPNYSKNKYDLKLAQAYTSYLPLFPPFQALSA